jgi:putative redox protein
MPQELAFGKDRDMGDTRFEKVTFAGSQGETLAGRLEWPAGPPRAFALFAHCFTCTKDIFAAGRIAAALAGRGVAVLRFDFTGLGASGGDFANTNFSSNVGDLVCAADFLRDRYAAPRILIGHSLGGAAVIAAAHAVPEAKLVATIGAPADPEHVKKNFTGAIEEIDEKGEAEVRLVGRPFRIRKQFLDDIAAQRITEHLANLRRALMIFHSPIDQIVGVENARRIYEVAKHPKSFIALDGADHLLSRRGDAVFVADMLAVWVERYIDSALDETVWPEASAGEVVVREAGAGGGRSRLTQHVAAGPHHLFADEPVSSGGADLGPDPYALLLAALGACTSMTVRLYADRKKWNLTGTTVRLVHRKIHAVDCEECETKEGKVDEIEREISFAGDLDEAQRSRLLEIADRCPVHRTLSMKNRILSRLV